MDRFIVTTHPASAGCAHFTSIQRAIDVAAAWGSPTVVRVYPGTYAEDVTLQPGVALAGVFAGARLGPGLAPDGRLLPTSRPIVEGRVRVAGFPGLYSLEGLSLAPPIGIALETLAGAPDGTWLIMRQCDVTAPPDAAAALALRGAAAASLADVALHAPYGLAASAALVLHDSPDLLVMERCTLVSDGATAALRVVQSDARLADCDLAGRIRHEGGGSVLARGGRIHGAAPLFVSTVGGFMAWRGGVLEPIGDPASEHLAVSDPPSSGAMFDFGGSVVPDGFPLAGPGASLSTSPTVLP